MLGAGFSSTDKLILSGSINQQNFLGTGKALSVDVNTSRLSRALGVSYIDPYITPDGISRAINVSTRLFNAQALALGDYRLRTSAAGMRFGIPYTDVDRLIVGAAVEQNEYLLGTAPPLRLLDTVNSVGDRPTALLGSLGWVRDTRDSGLAPTRGQLRSASVEVTVPVTELRFWRATYQHQVFFPISRDYTLALNSDVGVGQAFGGAIYPQFKNFYAGGIGSVRGFTASSLGRRYSDGVPSGGQVRMVANAEFLFPLPGSGADRTLRTFLYTDVGNVYDTVQTVDLSLLRVSMGAGLSWTSPVGPIKFSIGAPIKREPTDRIQRFQFQIGTGF
jgi:outer membrane protein insertion porin family